MSKSIIKKNIWFVLAQGIKIYFSNIDKFVIYMLFPVFGQMLGIILSFCIPFAFVEKVATLTDNLAVAMLLIILLAMPGLLIFVKAFWDFMVAYVALNSMTEGALTTGHVYDFSSHNEVATGRTFQFVMLLFTVGVLSSVGSSIFFMIPGFVLWIYFILVYQVFTFEPDLKIPDCFKRSFMLVRGSWFETFVLLAVLTFFSIYIITQGVSVIFDYLNLTDKVCNLFNYLTNRIPLDSLNRALVYFNKPMITPDMISKLCFMSVLSFIVTGLTLPMRSICWTLWYKALAENPSKINAKTKSKKEKSEVFSEE